GRYADLYDVVEFYRSGHPRYQRRPEARRSGARSREEVGRRDQGSISYVWRKRSGGFLRNAEWRQCREIRAGAWLARQCPHPHLPRLAVGGIYEAHLRAALSDALRRPAHVRYWPIADIRSCTAHVRFWG